eukprot:4538709-Amphidinium_carterae.2
MATTEIDVMAPSVRTQQEESRENPHLDEHRSRWSNMLKPGLAGRFMKDDEGNVYLKWKALML